MAFIVDIRLENRNLHLLYKALFELSSDRADFVSRLFSRPRPDGLGPTTSVAELFRRFATVSPSPEAFRWNAALVRERLLVTRGFPLSQTDVDSIDRALRAFYDDGPDIHFWGSQHVDPDAIRPSYRWLMTAEDATGQPRSFLAGERTFGVVKALQGRNLIVPVVGDFGGQGAIQGVADYVRAHGDVVRAFYGSNVTVYLNRDQRRAFCGNLPSLPADGRTWFVERDAVQLLTARLRACRRPAQ